MNDERRPAKNAARTTNHLAASVARPPVCVLELELDARPRVRLVADTWEDEQELRSYLGRPPVRDAFAQLGVAA
jgi:hypothetical protein